MDRTDLKTRLNVQMSFLNGSGKHTKTGAPLPPPGTDPWMACNAYAYRSSAGILGGLRSVLLTNDKIISKTEEQRLGMLLRVTVGSVLMDKKGDMAKEALRKFVDLEALPRVEKLDRPDIPENPDRSPAKLLQLVECMTSTDPNLGYTSRPLNGIWATAPYLHNGSVPTMYRIVAPAWAAIAKFLCWDTGIRSKGDGLQDRLRRLRQLV